MFWTTVSLAEPFTLEIDDTTGTPCPQQDQGGGEEKEDILDEEAEGGGRC